MTILGVLLKKHNIQDTDVLDVTKRPNLRNVNHATTTFDRAYYRPTYVHQIDTLYLPKDNNGDKYLLVVVDIGSGMMDCRPMSQLNADTTLKMLKNMYGLDNKRSNKVFSKPPLKIHVDKGSEFNNQLVQDFFYRKNIGLRFASTGRHTQQAIVERMNFAIGEVINKLQLHNENIVGEQDTDWVDYIPDIIEAVNDNAKKTKPILPKQDDNADVKCNGTECDILEVGTKVRIALDYPVGASGERLHGKFRAGDRRFSLKPYAIENVLMYPNQPIRYVIDGVKNNTFSKAELLPYVAPKSKQLTNERFLIDKIVKKKKEKNQIYYLVKWKGYDDTYNTWEAKKKLLGEVGEQFILDFEKNTEIKDS